MKLAKFKICFMALALLPLLGVSQDVSDRGQLRYNQVQQKASHNSYQRKDDILVQLKDFNIRCIEFDIHSKPSAPSDDWWVYHTKKGDAKVCRTLSECFSKVVEFHKSEPEHEVITIFFDVAGMGAKAHSKTDFYKQVLQFFPQNLIVKPSDLLAACPAAKNLQQSVTLAGCGWPMLKDLRGKFMFVISDGKADFRKAGYDPKSDLVFLVSDSVAPEKLNAQSDVVFFNMSGANPFAKTAREAGFVSRVYWLDQKKYQEAVALGANLLATDDLDPKEFPWTSTTQPDGFPFNIIKQ